MTLVEFNGIVLDYDLNIYKYNLRGGDQKVILITDIEYTPAFMYNNLYFPFFVIDINTKKLIQIKINRGNISNV